MQKNIFLSLLFSVIVFIVFLGLTPVFADQTLLNGQVGLQAIGTTAYNGAQPTDIRITVAKIIMVALTFLGVIFLAFTVFAGFKYMTAGGNEEKTKEALDMIKNAVIGLVIVLMSWGITRYSMVVLSKTVGNAPDYRTYTPSH